MKARISKVGQLGNKIGYTLIELVVVLVLFTIGAGMVFPAVSEKIFKDRASDFAWKLALRVRYGREAVVILGKPLFLMRDSDAFRFHIREEKGEIHKDVACPDLPIDPTLIVKFPENGIGFSPEGFCDETNVSVKDPKYRNIEEFTVRSFDGSVIWGK